jgi:trans-aconitate methyltransferase
LSAVVAPPPESAFAALRYLPRGGEALVRLMLYPRIKLVLDIGSGDGEHARILRDSGLSVTTVSLQPPADHVGDFLQWDSRQRFDAIWACHVLEHQVNPGLFLVACRERLHPGGVLAVTVPPAKHEIVGGHVTLWNAGLLLYQLILAGFDCRRARVGTYGYNISVLVQRADAELPALRHDAGDIERLARWFPLRVRHGFDGELPDIDW